MYSTKIGSVPRVYFEKRNEKNTNPSYFNNTEVAKFILW